MSRTSSAVRLGLVALLAALVVVLAWPTARQDRPLTWLDLIAPLAPGRPIAQDYLLSPPRRGEEHDVVFVARHVEGRGTIELHIVARGQWEGVRETPSFGIDFEESRSDAPPEDLERVTEALFRAVAAHDEGGLGSVDAIALSRAKEPPGLTAGLRGVTGLRGLSVGLLLVVAVVLLGTLRRGWLWVAGFTFLVGLGLRVAYLGLPFEWDQDVQRIQIAASSLGEILTGAGLQDRRPPLYFVLLHFVQLFGQSEWLVRLPAALFGALTAPALLVAVQRGRVVHSALASVMALVAAASPVLIARSREVSEIALFGILLVLLVGELARATERRSSRRELVVLAGLCALALWTSYLAVVGIAAAALAMVVVRKLDRRTAAALGAAMLLGAPALVLAVRTAFVDAAARQAAASHSGAAWGDRSVFGMLEALARLTAESVGLLLALLGVLAFGWAAVRRSRQSLLALSMFAALFVAVALAVPVARMQPYYLIAAIPLLLLGVAALEIEAQPQGERAAKAPVVAKALIALKALVAVAAVAFLGRAAPTTGNLYVADESFMATFAAAVRQQGVRHVATVTHYDATLLSYYLARQQAVALRADRIVHHPDGSLQVEGLAEEIVPLVQTHAPNQDPDGVAQHRLAELVAAKGPTIVVARNDVRLRELDQALSRCELLHQAARARLLRCHAPSVDGSPLPKP